MEVMRVGGGVEYGENADTYFRGVSKSSEQ